MNIYHERIQRLQALMQQEGYRLAILSFSDQMRYLTGYVENGHKRFLALFVPWVDEPVFVVPKMNVAQASQNLAQISLVYGWEDSSGWQDTVRTLFRGWDIRPGQAVLVDDELYAVHLLGLQSIAPNLTYLPADPVLSRLRRVKTPDELSAMRRAAEIIDTVMEATLASLKEGVTEIEVAALVEQQIQQHRSTPSFEPLICFGANAAMPHHTPDATPLKRGDMVIVDIGCTWEHYASDTTRTVAFGAPPDEEAERVYRTVAEAHVAAFAAVRPGILCEEIDRAARQVIQMAGYGENFIHRTGHGIGLSCHEPPYIQEGNTLPLEPGFCFSIEPGIYLSGRYGVRLENIVTVTETGALSLNRPIPKTLPIIA
ncbi:Xaa-Pro aminopeptidase [Chthonomonas calidirosea]|uniref:M24 family metallopeptidase n=1 Tax=Chthonomonas calidirosea TaxID=454171 RepID=UPI0006DD3B02|nr:Xaa-Pro peptidase family protein [Chthonomonas calidirosea]CEK12885.1 Xaa-Pro aminopeptidase [Chthonomonas calidirosea]